jgi:hypothetical protein
LVDNIVGHLLDGVSEPVLECAFDYWHDVDVDLGDRGEKVVWAGLSDALSRRRTTMIETIGGDDD